MKNIYLHGELCDQFGPCHSFAISSPGEAIRALEANFPGEFFNAIKDGAYHVVRHGNDNGFTENTLGMNFSSGSLHIIPVVSGSAGRRGKGFFNVILGAALIAGSLYFGFTSGFSTSMFAGITAGHMTLTGAALVLKGVGILKTPIPEEPEDPNDPRSHVIGGPVNVTREGGVVSLVYGKRVFVGSTVISAGLTTKEIDITDPDDGDDTGNGGGSGGGGGGDSDGGDGGDTTDPWREFNFVDVSELEAWIRDNFGDGFLDAYRPDNLHDVCIQVGDKLIEDHKWFKKPWRQKIVHDYTADREKHRNEVVFVPNKQRRERDEVYKFCRNIHKPGTLRASLIWKERNPPWDTTTDGGSGTTGSIDDENELETWLEDHENFGEDFLDEKRSNCREALRQIRDALVEEFSDIENPNDQKKRHDYEVANDKNDSSFIVKIIDRDIPARDLYIRFGSVPANSAGTIREKLQWVIVSPPPWGLEDDPGGGGIGGGGGSNDPKYEMVGAGCYLAVARFEGRGIKQWANRHILFGKGLMRVIIPSQSWFSNLPGIYKKVGTKYDLRYLDPTEKKIYVEGMNYCKSKGITVIVDAFDEVAIKTFDNRHNRTFFNGQNNIHNHNGYNLVTPDVIWPGAPASANPRFQNLIEHGIKGDWGPTSIHWQGILQEYVNRLNEATPSGMIMCPGNEGESRSVERIMVSSWFNRNKHKTCINGRYLWSELEEGGSEGHGALKSIPGHIVSDGSLFNNTDFIRLHNVTYRRKEYTLDTGKRTQSQVERVTEYVWPILERYPHIKIIYDTDGTGSGPTRGSNGRHTYSEERDTFKECVKIAGSKFGGFMSKILGNVDGDNILQQVKL